MATIIDATEYAKGYAAALAAIEILAGQFDDATLYRMSIQNIVPVHAIAAHTSYDLGSSQGWADWQGKRRQANRAARRGR